MRPGLSIHGRGKRLERLQPGFEVMNRKLVGRNVVERDLDELAVVGADVEVRRRPDPPLQQIEDGRLLLEATSIPDSTA